LIEYNLSYTQSRTKATKPFNQNPHPIQSISKTWRGITNAGQVVRQAIQLVEQAIRDDPGVVWISRCWRDYLKARARI
jgi:hypothetical protein